jgi:plasmid replication initiation protein
METTLPPINTTETLGVTPHYVLQHNAISRSAHNLSATAKKLTAMAMALLPSDLSSLSVSFTFPEFCDALGYERGGESYRIFKNAVEECMKSIIKIEGQQNNKGKKDWIIYHWFECAKFKQDTETCTMVFGKELAYFLKELKWLYSKINLKDFGNLQSRYALRIFELAISYSSLMGKDGNQKYEWYFERPIEELRFMLGIPDGAYKETKLFRQYAIEKPVKEINNAGLGVAIKAEGIKQGRKLTAIRFDCEKVQRTVSKKGKAKKESNHTQPPMSDPAPSSKKEKIPIEHLKDVYPEEYAELHQAYYDSAPPNLPEQIKLSSADTIALNILHERYCQNGNGIKK